MVVYNNYSKVNSRLEPVFNYLANKPDIIFKEIYPEDESYIYEYGEQKRDEHIAYDANSLKQVNLMNSCLFVVEDINLFINEIKYKGYHNINEGPQSLRGELNDIHSFLSSIENEYLDCLYNQYKYLINLPINEEAVKNSLKLHRSMFSARNIRKIAKS